MCSCVQASNAEIQSEWKDDMTWIKSIQIVGSKLGHAGAGHLNCLAVECLPLVKHILSFCFKSSPFINQSNSCSANHPHTSVIDCFMCVWKVPLSSSWRSTLRNRHRVNIWSWSGCCFMTLFLSQLVTLTGSEARVLPSLKDEFRWSLFVSLFLSCSWIHMLYVLRGRVMLTEVDTSDFFHARVFPMLTKN